MQLRPDIQLRAMIKSLSDAVMPAVDPNNKLAVEQLQLTIGLLAMMEQRMPLQFRFDCDELERLLGFANELGQQPGGKDASAALTEVAAAAESGSDVLGRAKADPAELLETVRRLRATCGKAVDAIYREGDAASRDLLKKTVLSISGEQLLRDRSWVSTQGWEPHPESIPPVEQLLSIGKL